MEVFMMKSKILLVGWCIIMLIGLFGCALVSNAESKEVNINKTLFVALNMDTHGNMEYVKECIENGADVNEATDAMNQDYSPLTMAFINANKNIAKYLIEKGADVNYSHLDASLLMAMAGGQIRNTEYCRILVENGAEVNKKNLRGNTALDYAIRVGNIECVRYLLDHGALVSENTINMLLEHNNNRGYASYALKRLVIKTAQQQKFNTKIEPIVEAAMLGDSQTVLNIINDGHLNGDELKELLFTASAFCNDDVLQKIIDTGIDYNALDVGKGVLQLSAENGNLDGVKFWIAQGLPVRREGFIDDPLLAAIQNNHYDVAEYLFQKGEMLLLEDLHRNPKFPWVTSNNPMDDVIQNNNIEMIELLVENAYPLTEETMAHAAQKAIEFHQMEILRYFLDNGIDVNYVSNDVWSTFLEASCQFENIEAAVLLVEKGADVNGVGTSVPLLNAVSKGNVELVKLLIDNGADVNRIRVFDDGSKSDSALMTATQGGYLDIIKMLVENGANIELQHWSGNDTVILVAAATSNHVLQHFIDKGVAINYQNCEGETALMRAVASENLPNINALLAAGADTTLKNSEGLTALDIAKKQHSNMVEQILQPDK